MMTAVPLRLRLKRSVRFRLKRNVRNRRAERRNKLEDEVEGSKKRVKRASPDQLWRSCQTGDCPEDVRNRYTLNTPADKILTWFAPLVFFGGAGVGAAALGSIARQSGIPKGQTLGTSISNAIRNIFGGRGGYSRVPLTESPVVPGRTVAPEGPRTVVKVINPVYEGGGVVTPELTVPPVPVETLTGFTEVTGPGTGSSVVEFNNPAFDPFIGQAGSDVSRTYVDTIVNSGGTISSPTPQGNPFGGLTIDGVEGHDIELNVFSPGHDTSQEETFMGLEYVPESSTPLSARIGTAARRVFRGFRGPWRTIRNPEYLYEELQMEDIIGDDEEQDIYVRPRDMELIGQGPNRTVSARTIAYREGMRTRQGTVLSVPEGLQYDFSPITGPAEEGVNIEMQDLSSPYGNIEELTFAERGDMGVDVNEMYWDIPLNDPPPPEPTVSGNDGWLHRFLDSAAVSPRARGVPGFIVPVGYAGGETGNGYTFQDVTVWQPSVPWMPYWPGEGWPPPHFEFSDPSLYRVKKRRWDDCIAIMITVT
ncbi:L2 [Fulmarus glacialis papillomavirus 1]|uniref:L2 n=1 Tax=Fulmarus glacialis papillomavirus 1 TaxID=1463817 RepID=A0A059TAS3_9PAPI|nr:L2 [Fulmarus glacialis papillomavirus 1]AHV82118.1 L2 [Fulmarus glacialis papillomavirus 1]